MPRSTWLAVAVALASSFAAIACSPSQDQSPPSEAGATVGSPCQTPDDCPPPTLCAWPLDGGCDAQGTCVQEDLACEDSGPTVCACDGFEVVLSCIYGAGNAPQPVPANAHACVNPFEAGTD